MSNKAGRIVFLAIFVFYLFQKPIRFFFHRPYNNKVELNLNIYIGWEKA